MTLENCKTNITAETAESAKSDKTGKTAESAKSDKTKTRQLIRHPIPPLYSAESKILILGSFPSVKSREMAFFYGHPQNRFWKLVSQILGAPFPETVPERRDFLLSHRIAVWDVIASCEIHGSSDASIRNAVPNDLRQILDGAQIRQIYVNGQTAGKLYRKYQEKALHEEYGDCAKAVILPSTSPANAAWNMERLQEAWKVILEPLGKTDTDDRLKMETKREGITVNHE